MSNHVDEGSGYGPQVPEEQRAEAEAVAQREIARIHKLWGWK